MIISLLIMTYNFDDIERDHSNKSSKRGVWRDSLLKKVKVNNNLVHERAGTGSHFGQIFYLDLRSRYIIRSRDALVK